MLFVVTAGEGKAREGSKDDDKRFGLLGYEGCKADNKFTEVLNFIFVDDCKLEVLSRVILSPGNCVEGVDFRASTTILVDSGRPVVFAALGEAGTRRALVKWSSTTTSPSSRTYLSF